MELSPDLYHIYYTQKTPFPNAVSVDISLVLLF